MFRSILKVLLFILVVGGLQACSESESNGPCEYTKEKFNMKILDVLDDPDDENMFIILVDLDGNISFAEGSHTLSEVRNVVTNYNFVVNNHITIGNIYTGTVHQMVSGSGNCEKEIIDWDQKLSK